MARLEIEVGVSGHSGVKKNLNDIENGIDKLNAKHSKLTKNIAEVTAVSRGLEAELGKLGSQFRSGAISESVFNKESREVKEALASARQASVQFQSELTSLNATIKQNTSGQDQYGKSVKRLEGYHKSFNSGIRSTNSIAIEFGRIVQDLPYGVQGVANNIQQLTTNFGYYATSVREAAKANGQVVTTSQILKGAFSSFLTPANILTLSISAITAGWVAYERWSQRAAKATKENKEETDKFNEGLKKFISTQDAATRAIASGLSESSSELSTLKALRSIIEDETISRNKRLSAVKEIQRLYPDYFGNLSDEKILAGQVESQYNRLTQSILASGKARAAIKGQSSEYEKLVAIDIRREKRGDKIAELESKILSIRKESEKFAANPSGAYTQLLSEAARLEGQRNKLIEERTQDGLEEIKALQNIESLQNLVNDSVREGGNIVKETVEQTKKQGNVTKETVDKVAKAIEESNNRIQVNSEEGRKKELAQVDVWYKSRLELAKDNDDALKILEDNKRAERAVINAKWDAKELEQAQKLADDIAAQNAKNEERAFNELARFLTRSNRNREAALIEQLENETRIKISNAIDDEEKLNAIYAEFAQKRQAIIDEQSQRSIIANNDGSPLYKEIAQAESELTNLQNKFREGLISPEAFEASREGLQSFIDGLDIARDASMQLGDMAGTIFESILFDGQDTSKKIASAFKSLASSIISDLLRIAATKAIANIFTGGGAGILGSIFGFSSGGYTGNGGRNQIAGVVHGQEMVINAEATKKNRALLEAINNNRALPSNSVATPTSGLSQNTTQVFIPEQRTEGSTLVTVFRRALKEEDRYVG